MDIGSTLSFRLHALVYTMDLLAERIITKNSDINFAQFLVLLCVHQNPQTDQKFMASWLRVTEPTVSYMVKKLSDSNYLVVNKNAKDTRQKNISLSQKGNKLVQKLYPLLESELKPHFAVISEQRLSELNQDIDKLLSSVCRIN